ncbi:unnamed protein product [Penicillium glandicola]
MKHTSTPPKRTNGPEDPHEYAERNTQSPPQLPSQSSTEETLVIPGSAASSLRDPFPPSGRDILSPPPTMSTRIPPLPDEWEGTENMKLWLQAKMVEDQRKLQEERTYQVNAVLETRRIEHSILSDSLLGGVPPNLVPLIFNGIYSNGLGLGLTADLQRQLSASGSGSSARPMTPQQRNNPGPAPPTRLPVASQPPQQGPRQPPQAQANPTSCVERGRTMRSEREELKLTLEPRDAGFGDKYLLNTAFRQPLPIVSSMLHNPPFRPSDGSSDKASGTREKRQQAQKAPQEAHYGSSQESKRPQSQSQQQEQPKIVPGNLVIVSNAPSHIHPKRPRPPSPKRKDQKSHEKVHEDGLNEISSRLRALCDDLDLDQRQQQRGSSSSHEPHTSESGSSEQAPESASDSAGESSASPDEELHK